MPNGAGGKPSRTVEWYFDFLSPFAYLQAQRLDELPDDVDIVFRPILFGGLLVEWETKGPGQIPPKRLLTLRHTLWLSQRLGVPCRLPPKFPFNPLKALRPTLSLGSKRATRPTPGKANYSPQNRGNPHRGRRSYGYQSSRRL